MVLAAADIETIIKRANLGTARRAAQDGACSPFAVALFDMAEELGLAPRLICAAFHLFGRPQWYHACVDIGGVLFDSLGVVNHEVVRNDRLKIHHSVETKLELAPDSRDIEDEDVEFHEFCLAKLRRAARLHAAERAVDAASTLTSIPYGA